MKKYILIITTFLLFQQYAMGQASQMLHSKQLKNVTFFQFQEEVLKQTGIKIYYPEEWTGNIQVSIPEDSISVTDALNRILRNEQLYYQVFPDSSIYLLNRRIKPLSVDELRDNLTREETENQGNDANQYLRGTKPAEIMHTITVGSEKQYIPGKLVHISGTIKDLEDGNPIAGATMVIMETGQGAVSNEDGLLSMSIRTGEYTVQFNFIGKEQINRKIKINSGGYFSVEMKSGLISIDEVQIQAKQYRKINSTDVGVVRLTMKSLKDLPVFMGEKDVIKIAKLMPGITSAGEASSGVNVRGGNVDQNLFYLNNIPVYNTSHLFGFFSAFNSDLIRDYAIYKGHVPVNYGGRLSSVFNITTRQGNNKKFAARANISPISGMVSLETPVIKNKASILLSARSSYSDWILKRMPDPLIRESEAAFRDYSAAFTYTLSESSEINGFYYHSYDKFKYSDLNDYNYSNDGFSINLRKQFNSQLTGKFSAVSSAYVFDYVNTIEVSQAYEHKYNLRHNEIKADFNYDLGSRHELDVGTNLIQYQLARGTVLPYGDFSLKIPMELGDEKALEGGVYVGDNFTVNSRLTINAGIRYSYYTFLGPTEVRTYIPGLPLDDENVSGTEVFGANEPVAFYSGPEFRSALNYKASDNTSFKLSYTQMRQYFLMLSNTISISPTDQWKLADYHIVPPQSRQVSGGVYHIGTNKGLTTSLELYYKKARDVVDYKDGADFISTPYTETLVLQGTQESYGMELLIEKGKGKLNGWISYTLSRSIMQFDGDNPEDMINNGNPYPSNHDRPHVLNVIANYKFNRRFTLASNVVYMTGKPVTFPSSLYFIDDIAYLDYYARNQFRVPDYFRIDLSLTIEGNLKSKKLFHSTWSFNVYNLLGRNNPQSLYFEPNEYFINGYSFSVIGVPIATVTWNIKLGNYETE